MPMVVAAENVACLIPENKPPSEQEIKNLSELLEVASSSKKSFSSLVALRRQQSPRLTWPLGSQQRRSYAHKRNKRADETTESHFIYHPHDTESKIFISAEHSSNRIPDVWKSLEEPRLKEMHWSYDIGTEKFAFDLARRIGAPALLARFGRLLIDVNRPLESDTLIRDKCDNKPVLLGTNVSAEDRQKRIDLYWKPYRAAFDKILQEYQTTQLCLGIHSFTPNYEGQQRAVEIGVLCTDLHTEVAKRINDHFVDAGFNSKINEPWTGDICDVLKTANQRGKIGIVIEFRQDLIVLPKWRSKAEQRLIEVLHELDLTR